MATMHQNFDEYALESLKHKVSEKIGYQISNKPDCIKLSEIISKNEIGYISDTTLYRLFFYANKHKPYKHTLDILCKYAGYNNSQDFLDNINTKREILNKNAVNTIQNHHKNLIFYCIQNETYKPLMDFFNSLEDTPVYIKENTCLNLYDSLILSDKQVPFFNKFVENKFIREYLLEKGYDPKFRINNYEIAYIKYIEKINLNSGIEHMQEFIFGNTVLFRYYYLNNEYLKAMKVGKNIYQEIASIDLHQNDLHIFPFIRYKAYKLWYLTLSKTNQNIQIEYVLYLLNLCKKIKSSLSFYDTSILYHTIAEAFLHSSIPEKYHWELKKIFSTAFDKFPDIIYSKHLKYSLNYFEPNGLIKHRP